PPRRAGVTSMALSIRGCSSSLPRARRAQESCPQAGNLHVMSVRVLVIHGPNLNLLGLREPEIYGGDSLPEINRKLEELARHEGMELRITQSNAEGAILDAIHEALDWADAIVINPAAYTHTSVAIRDAIKAVRLPSIEVHLSNTGAREEFRQTS